MSIRPILASLCLTLLLAACGTLTPAPTPTPPATSTPPPTVTPTFDPAPLLQANPYPGTDLGLQPEAAYALPDEVQAKLKEMGAIPILANGLAGSVKDGLCRLAMPEQLVSGAQVNAEAAGGGAAPFALPDGQVEQSGIWQLPVEGGWQCVAFVAGLDNQLGLEPGTVGVWFFSGGGKAGVEILNLDKPLRVFVESPNRADVRLENGRLVFNTLGPDGKVIEEQVVVFLTEEQKALLNLPVLEDITPENVLAIEGLQPMDWEKDILSGRFGEAAYQKLQASLNGGKPLYGMPATPEAMVIIPFSDDYIQMMLNKHGASWIFGLDLQQFYSNSYLLRDNRPFVLVAKASVDIGGEECVATAEGRMNPDKNWEVVVWIVPKEYLRRNAKIRPNGYEDLTNKEGFFNQNEKVFLTPAVFQDREGCLKSVGSDWMGVPKAYCDWYEENQAEIEPLLRQWSYSNYVPPELRKFPLIGRIDPSAYRAFH